MLNSSRVQIFISILVILTLLTTLACGGKGQEIRDMTAEKLQGVAEKLADEGTATPASSPMPEPIPNDVSPVTSLPTAPPTTMPASVPTVEPTPTSPTISTADAPIPTPTVTSPSATAIPTSIKVEPQSAEPGEWVTITGTGFPPHTAVHQLDINASGIGSISVLPSPPPSTDASGGFTTDMLIFLLPNGDHEVVATVWLDTYTTATTTATVTVTGSTYLSGIDYSAASINVEPVVAAAGGVVTITGSGFPPFGLLQRLELGGIDVRPVPQPHTDSEGNLETQIMIPQLEFGITQVIVAIGEPTAVADLTIASPTPAGPPTNSCSRIAFLSNRTGNMDIYVMNSDGTGQLQLTTSPSDEVGPVWSPNGSKIAFYSNQDGNTDVYVMNADGTGQTRLTQGLVPSWDPSWSPDGTRIAFSSVSENNADIYVMNSDGSDVQRITNDPAYDTHPSWSPDGNKISFVSAKDGNEEIYVMNTDGSDQTRLTNNLARDMNPSWSPDGDRIAFNSNLSDIDAGFGEDHEIYVMSTDGSNQIRLTKSPNNNGSPSWCADGSKIAFTSYLKDGDNDEIYVMNDDGTDLTRVTESIGIDAGPSWSPVISTTNP